MLPLAAGLLGSRPSARIASQRSAAARKRPPVTASPRPKRYARQTQAFSPGVAVAIPEVRVGRVITARPREQTPQSQQPDVAYHQTPSRRCTSAARRVTSS